MKTIQLFIFLLLTFSLSAQKVEKDSTFKVYYYPNGQIASEGYLVKNKPDGYWKTYRENGTLKAEGNRKNFELDSTWKFYDESGSLSLQINYKSGKKHGKRITYLPNEIIHENFEWDIKTGNTSHFDRSARLIKTIPFEKGLENGLARTYDTLGNIIELLTYKKGYIIERERINRTDAENRPHGPWKWFYPNGNLKAEGQFQNGMRNGLFKEFDLKGNMKKIEKYIDGVKQESAEEVARLELRRDYFPDGKVKIEATYREGIPEGVRREFAPSGEVEQSYVFRNGKLIAQGIMKLNGLKESLWKEFYPDGVTKSIGNYSNGQRVGEWEFYYPQGTLEQKGLYNDKGKPEGKWTWYFSSGQVLREENYRNGLKDGQSTQYSIDGKIVAQGDFIDDKEDGQWKFQNNNYREEGSFVDGLRNGNWKHYYENGTLAFEGSFVEDVPNGKHTYYFPDGKKSEEGAFLMGLKNGEWRKWNPDGSILLSISYMNGIERSYDGFNIPDEEIVQPE